MWEISVLSFLLGYVAIVIIGPHECFRGTAIERAHYALTDGMVDAVG